MIVYGNFLHLLKVVWIVTVGIVVLTKMCLIYKCVYTLFVTENAIASNSRNLAYKLIILFYVADCQKSCVYDSFKVDLCSLAA